MLPILIVHWNRPMECAATMAAFEAQGVPVSIRVVDNNSRPERVEALKKLLPDSATMEELSENRGWGGGLNVLLKNWLTDEDSEYCVVSAHDALLKPDCLKFLLAAMDRDRSLGIACPQYENAEVATYGPVRGIVCVMSTALSVGQVSPVEVVHGTIMIFRRECIAKIGLFDERYFAYGDEAEIGLRARKMGWQLGLVWGAVVMNPGTWTPSPVVGYLSARNSLRMAADYGGYVRAATRVLLMLCNSLRLAFLPSVWNSMSSPRARLMGMRDFLLGRYGPPPRSLLPKVISEK